MPDPDAEKERDLTTILEDVRTIKAILQNQDAPLPPVWRLIYFVAVPGLILIAVLKFFVPALAAMSFLDTLLWLWLPVFFTIAVIISIAVSIYLRRLDKRFLAQGRVQIFLYTRLILAPAVLTIGYLLSLNSTYSLDGAMAVLVAVGLTQVTVLMPRQFRVLPFVFLIGGWAELALDFRGAVWTLVNTLSVAASVLWFATLLQKDQRDQKQAEGR